MIFKKDRILTGICMVILSFPLSAQTFSEILGRPENNSITINALFSQVVQVYFEYGTQTVNYTSSTQPVTTIRNEPVEDRLSGLSPDTRYYYRTRYRIPGEITYKSGEEHTFTTQRPPGSSFSFTIESDPHPYDKKCYGPLWNIALQNQLADSADFMIDMGDTFGDDHFPFTITSEEVLQLHLDARDFFSKVCHSLPFFFCQGNHEGENGYYLLQTPPENLAVWETLWRKKFWPNPYPDGFFSGNTDNEPYGIGNPENYYAWEWGDALFVVLDAYRYYTVSAKPGKWDWTLGKAQYDWLKSTLEKNKSKFKFVFIHHLLGEARGAVNLARQFEWGGYDQKGTTWEFSANRPGWEMPIHQLLVKNKVSVLFQGHDHLYAREELDGLVYQTVPMPSDSSYHLGMIANADAFGGIKLSGSGHLLVTVTPGKATVDYVLAVLPKDETANRKNGQVIFSYSLNESGTTSISHIPQEFDKPPVKAWPNPFRDSVEIQFYLEKSGNVRILIYNMEGRLVDRLDEGVLPSGLNTVKWDAINRKGRLLRKGIFNCIIESGSEQISNRLVLY